MQRDAPLPLEGPQPIGALLADMIERLLEMQLAAQPNDSARKRIVMDLRARGVLSDELTAMAFYWFPGMCHA
jgi:hypothetical protein